MAVNHRRANCHPPSTLPGLRAARDIRRVEGTRRTGGGVVSDFGSLPSGTIVWPHANLPGPVPRRASALRGARLYNRGSSTPNPPSWLPSSQHENYAHLLPADGHGRPTWSRRSPGRGGARRSPESPRTLCRRPRTDGSTSQANLLPSAPTRLTYQSISSRTSAKLQSVGRGGMTDFAKKR